jgi:hypothetical protein
MKTLNLHPLVEEPPPHVLLQQLDQARPAIRQRRRPGVPFRGYSGPVKDSGDPRPHPAAIPALVPDDGHGEGAGKFTVVFKPSLEEFTGPYVKAVPVWTKGIRRSTYEKRKGPYWLR